MLVTIHLTRASAATLQLQEIVGNGEEHNSMIFCTTTLTGKRQSPFLLLAKADVSFVDEEVQG